MLRRACSSPQSLFINEQRLVGYEISRQPVGETFSENSKSRLIADQIYYGAIRAIII